MGRLAFLSLSLDFGDDDVYLLACFCRLVDAVDDRLIVEDLGCGNRCGTALLDRIDERTNLVEEEVSARQDRDLGLSADAADVVIERHRSADGAVPAVGRGDTERAVLTEDDGITGGIGVHCPGNTEVKDDSALETDECCCKVIYAEAGCILGG